jgi:peptide subunit release factor 1 (eRF1)
MLQNIDLRELAALSGNGRDFVSVYFQGRDGLDRLKARERNLRTMLEDSPDELEHFDLSMQMIREVLEENPTRAEGVCVFACALLDFVRGYPISMPLPNEIHVGPAPYIRPLAELQDEHQTFAVLACSNRATRIYLVTNEAVDSQERVRGGVKNHVRKGGWSQMRYSRRRSNQLLQYAKEVASALEELVRAHRLERIVLLGSAETMNEIEEALAPTVAEKVVGKERFDLHQGEDAVLEEAYELYFAEEREEEQRYWERIHNEYKRNGLAAVGPTEVLDALRQGRVETLLITRDAQIRGVQCRECEHVVHGVPQTCQQCGSDSIFEIDLLEALTRHAKLTGAHVEFSDEIPGLTRVKHAAALLRY